MKTDDPKPVANPAPYAVEDQGKQYDWTMTDAEGKTTQLKKPEDAAATAPIARPASTGIKTSGMSGRLTGSH